MDIRVEDDKPESDRNVLGEPMDLCCEIHWQVFTGTEDVIQDRMIMVFIQYVFVQHLSF